MFGYSQRKFSLASAAPSKCPPQKQIIRLSVLLSSLVATVVGSSLLCSASAYGQGSVPLWTNRYPAPPLGINIPSAIAVDNTGNVFVTGTSYEDGDLLVMATIKYSSVGVPLWTNRFPDQARAIGVDTAGNVFVAGSEWTVAYSNAGATLWTNRYPFYLTRAMAVDHAGNVLVTGISFNGNNSF